MRFFPPPQKHHSAKNKSARTKKRKKYEKRDDYNSYLDDQKRSPVLVECEGHDEIYSSLKVVYKSGCCLSEGKILHQKEQSKIFLKKLKNKQTTEKNATNM